MGFGGSAAAMVTSMKNNKRSKSTTFKDMKSYKKVTYSKLNFHKKATPRQLQKIREELQAKNKKDFVRKLIVIILFLTALIYFVGFYKF